MKINAIQNFNWGSNIGLYRPTIQVRPNLNTFPDTFEKSNIISFNGKFETMFPAAFFNKILKEGISCAYSNIPLIPKEDFRVLTSLNSLNKPISLQLEYLNLYKNNLYPHEQKVLNFINSESLKHPQKTIAQILLDKSATAEKHMRLKQVENLNKLLIEARAIPENDFSTLKYYVIDYLKRITSQNPQGIILDPSKITRMIKNMGLQDKKTEENMLKIVSKIPTEDNSLDAYIYGKTKNAGNMTPAENQQLSHKIIMDLLSKSVASDEHFYPQALYRAEEKSGKHKGDPFRVSFLTSKLMNEIKRDMPPDDFIKSCQYNVPENLQKHIDRLTEIHKKWRNESREKDANRLAQYILTLKSEAEKRSKYVKLNIDELYKQLEPQKMADYTTLIKKFLDITE